MGQPARDGLKFGLLPLLARLALSVEFVYAAQRKAFGWSGQAAYMASQGMTFIPSLRGAALVIEPVGSLCLITGFVPPQAAGVMCLHLAILPVRLPRSTHIP